MRNFIKIVAAVALALTAGTTMATTLTFENFTVSKKYIESGFVAQVKNEEHLYIFRSQSCIPRCADNKTFYAGLGYHGDDEFFIRSLSGKSFTFRSFSAAEFLFSGTNHRTWAVGIDVVGTLLNGTTITQRFTLDQLNDGEGGNADFETFLWDSKQALTEIRFFGIANRYSYAGYAVDNVVLTEVTANVPEPTSIALLGLSLLGFAVSRRKSSD